LDQPGTSKVTRCEFRFHLRALTYLAEERLVRCGISMSVMHDVVGKILSSVVG
jgi:hypothetical protein